MKTKVTGTNYWDGIKTYLHISLQQQPTPFMANDIKGRQINSDINFTQFDTIKEVELKKGDYVMLITKEDWIRSKEYACGHMHYFDGKKLISVYTKKAFNEVSQ